MGLGVESHGCHVSFVCHYINAMKELVSVSSRFRAFRIDVAIGVYSAKPVLRHKITNSPARPRYGCAVDDGMLF